MIRTMHYLPLYTAILMAGMTGIASAAAIQHFRTMNQLMYGLSGGGYGTMNYNEIYRARKNNRRAKTIKRYRHG